MNVEIATQLYDHKYRMLLNYEYYMDLLHKGVSLLQAQSLEKNVHGVDMKAMNIALEYNIELLTHHLS